MVRSSYKPRRNKSQFYIGIALVIYAGIMMMIRRDSVNGLIVIGILGIIMIAISRYKLLK